MYEGLDEGPRSYPAASWNPDEPRCRTNIQGQSLKWGIHSAIG